MTVEVAKKPLPIRALNGGYRTARRLRKRPLTLRKYRLMDKASRQAGGLIDFGDPRFEPGLDALIESIESEDRLNGFGRVLATTHITKLLRQRLLMTAHLAAHPEVMDETIERPLFIIGGPRTGTTVSHHLLSQDDQFRFPFTWECDEVHPPLDPSTMHTDPRIKACQKDLDRAEKLIPNLDASHPVGALEAQECALLHAYEFCSATFHPMFNCQGYDHWMADQDFTWVYERQKLMLQYMQSGGLRPSEGWLLKTPPHMEHIDAILAVFPDARFVTTYREPTEVVASGCSLIGGLIQMVQDDVDWHDLGRHLEWRVGQMFDRNVALREQFADRRDHFIDFPMQRMVRGPLSCVGEIYERFHITLTDRTRQKMDRFMAERGMVSRKPHIYDPADYGLDPTRMWARFQHYRDFYGIESEGA